ncbi:hypothetical protein KW790_01435 [Candidatus Parcubacteria bacterium]|nr:hypothetical protein [Candidatus Parcubacteria bacterium]
MKSQEKQRGLIIPLIALGVMLVLGGVLYYYSHRENGQIAQNGNPAAIGVVTSTPVVLGTLTPGPVFGEVTPSRPITSSPKPIKPKVTRPIATSYRYTGSAIEGLAEVSSRGVLAERLGWNTFTNRDYSYALSFPREWSQVGGGNLVLAGAGGAQVSVSAGSVAGQDLATFAVQSGATSATATTVNGYQAVKSYEGASTVYYIVNGDMGYRIALSGVSESLSRAILLTFTFTSYR